MSRLCPDCHGQELRAETANGVTLDACPNCAGLWFDEGEIQAATFLDPRELAALDAIHIPQAEVLPQREGKGMCPVCRTPMQITRYLYNSPIELDTCPNCDGVWVQNAELEAMGSYIREQRSQPNDTLIQHQLAAAECMAEFDAKMVSHRIFQRVMKTLSLRRFYL